MSGRGLERSHYTTFEGPKPGVDLFAFGINDRGVIVDEYPSADSESGLVRDERGHMAFFGAKGIESVKINDHGQIVGQYSRSNPTVNNSSKVRAYLWDRGKVTTSRDSFAAFTSILTSQ